MKPREIISAKDALKRGLPRYFTGKPCKHGHIAERKTSGRNCLECFKKIQRRRRDRGMWGRSEKFGLTQSEYYRIFQLQNGRCAVCSEKAIYESSDAPSRQSSLVIDHDHATGKVRGLLCRSCNYILGFAKDDPEILEQAAEYLRIYKNKNRKTA